MCAILIPQEAKNLNVWRTMAHCMATHTRLKALLPSFCTAATSTSFCQVSKIAIAQGWGLGGPIAVLRSVVWCAKDGKALG
jgi:hypothetical protein